MSKKHTILMLACCVIGMGAVLAIYAFKVPFNNVVLGLMLLICPLSHFLMMGAMGHGKQEGHEMHDHADMLEKQPSNPKSLREG